MPYAVRAGQDDREAMADSDARPPPFTAAGVEPPEAGVQRVGGLTCIPGLLREFGADPAAALAAAGLAPDALDAVDARIPFRAACRLLHEAAVRSGRPHFPLLSGARWRIAHMGIVGELAASAATLGEALEVLAVYQRLNSGGGAVVLDVGDARAGLGYAIHEPDVPHAELVYEAVLAMGVALVRELVGPQWRPTEVLLARRQPAEAAPFRRLFRAPLRFDSDRSVLHFPRRDLARPIRSADPVRFATLEARANAAAPGSLPLQLRRALRLLMLQRVVSGDAAAGMLAMHRRTLNRRLRASGTTFQRELDRVRFDVACQLLTATGLTANEVAFALGYEDPSSFVRAFRRWTGSTPSRWRTASAAAAR